MASKRLQLVPHCSFLANLLGPKNTIEGDVLHAAIFDIVVTGLVQARWAARALRIWIWDENEALTLCDALDAVIRAGGGDPALWRIDIIQKPFAGAELVRLGYLDAALCGAALAALEDKERQRSIEILSRLIATDGYLHADGLGERLRDRFVRDAAAPGLYRPVALTLDLSFL